MDVLFIFFMILALLVPFLIKGKNIDRTKCSGCGIKGVPMTTLPFLGARLFCKKCASEIIRDVR